MICGPCDTFERLSDRSELQDKGDSLKLGGYLRGLPLSCKVGTSTKGEFQRILSLAAGDGLEFGKYFQFMKWLLVRQEVGRWVRVY